MKLGVTLLAVCVSITVNLCANNEVISRKMADRRESFDLKLNRTSTEHMKWMKTLDAHPVPRGEFKTFRCDIDVCTDSGFLELYDVLVQSLGNYESQITSNKINWLKDHVLKISDSEMKYDEFYSVLRTVDLGHSGVDSQVFMSSLNKVNFSGFVGFFDMPVQGSKKLFKSTMGRVVIVNDIPPRDIYLVDMTAIYDVESEKYVATRVLSLKFFPNEVAKEEDK